MFGYANTAISGSMHKAIELFLLGPLEMRKSGAKVPLGGVKQQTLVAYLCLHANQPVSMTSLTAALWGERPPPSSKKNVQLYVSRLRKLLEGHDKTCLSTVGDGYMLSIAPERVDLGRCQVLWNASKESRSQDDYELAETWLRQAIRLWRGSPLSGLGQTVVMQAEVARLEQLQLALFEDYCETQFSIGRYAEVIPDLFRLVTLYPYTEKLRGYLMLAMWRSGQRHNALAYYREVYHLLVEKMGIEPARQLQLLHQAILTDDVELGMMRTREWALNDADREGGA